MKIEHIAIWVENLETMRDFYTTFFNTSSSEKYINEKKGFSSYFLSFGTGARIEIMHRSDIFERTEFKEEKLGLAHLAISVGSIEKVNQLTETIRKNGFQIIGEPRFTGDDYYESIVSDPEGNRIEITE
ncbi:MAG: VOC family protein [Bacteroidales bacterium]|nr:VOC family protein [Bacteroidales bacterium]MCF8457521.1 VOC family protein [Bacteroidales bacterium]